MALETMFYPQDPIYYASKEFYNLGGAVGLGYENDFQVEDRDFVGRTNTYTELQNGRDWDPNSSPDAYTSDQLLGEVSSSPAETSAKRKRRRSKCSKNKEELENQRMTHIAVERNRRKQMNEYLAVIRSLMPTSYVQRGDQASIIGGAINFVKELEQELHTLEAKGRSKQESDNNSPPIFGDFFTFPRYSTHQNNNSSGIVNNRPMADNPSALAEIEVTLVESHANLKILSKRRPRQLLKIVSGLQCLCLSILHLNVTTVDQMVLYTISVKIEDGCRMTTADEIADAVNQLLGRIQEEAISG